MRLLSNWNRCTVHVPSAFPSWKADSVQWTLNSPPKAACSKICFINVKSPESSFSGRHCASLVYNPNFCYYQVNNCSQVICLLPMSVDYIERAEKRQYVTQKGADCGCSGNKPMLTGFLRKSIIKYLIISVACVVTGKVSTQEYTIIHQA